MSRDYVSGRGSRDFWTSDAALVGGGSETFGVATQIVWGVGAETFAFDAALEGGGTETDCTSDTAYVYIYPYEEMRELNFHSGSSIYSSQWFACLASHTSWSNSPVAHPPPSSHCSFVSRVQRLSACGCVTLLPPPKLQTTAPQVFVIGDYVASCLFMLELNFHSGSSITQVSVFDSVDHFRDVSVRTADIEMLGAIYIDCCVPVMLGVPIGSETR
ncbi:hypothetical protein F2Q70_00020228 [Brassica cretica]|uniref:Uncharacterized protein n=1 Tax=Brassica cretica TaxID=69181 RepID=A0A8S9GV41_BRACR|nr:hypothetical protein F2Q70_00020228 [Brassica cretica]